ncbi:MAG: thiamine phosphate synthase [Bacteroides sp.]|nr:thiamine phosphate synthase [Bacteroides sp.]
MSFIRIAFTPPVPADREAERICQLLDSGVDLVHLRHPGISEEEAAEILSGIPREYLGRITLHDHFRLAERHPVGGIHLNRRNPEEPEGFAPMAGRIRRSRSCHTFEEVTSSRGFDYVTLSPVFDSISKHGYRAAFDYDDLKAFLAGCPVGVIALGGVTPAHESRLIGLGFRGAAMLGHYWA